MEKWIELPDLCLAIIFYEFSLWDFLTLSLVCKRWYRVIKEISYWTPPKEFKLHVADDDHDLDYDKIKSGSLCYWETESLCGQCVQFSFVIVSVCPDGINVVYPFITKGKMMLDMLVHGTTIDQGITDILNSADYSDEEQCDAAIEKLVEKVAKESKTNKNFVENLLASPKDFIKSFILREDLEIGYMGGFSVHAYFHTDTEAYEARNLISPTPMIARIDC